MTAYEFIKGELRDFTIYPSASTIESIVERYGKMRYDEGLRDAEVRLSKVIRYCPYCGDKLSYKVSTYVNSDLMCKNKLCKGE